MKKIISALAAVLCIALLSAGAKDTDAHIYGHIVDSKTGEHLPHIVVMLRGTTVGVASDKTGHYFLRNLPIGRFVVEVSAVGYKTQAHEIDIKDGMSYEVNFMLEEDMVQLDGVIVSATRSETTRRMSPTLVNVVDMEIYNNLRNASIINIKIQLKNFFMISLSLGVL